jgi:hypothetical protein
MSRANQPGGFSFPAILQAADGTLPGPIGMSG